MRSIFFILVALAVIGLANWAYQENYRTQAAIRDVEQLHSEISELRERLAILRAEWAYLNRPDRLRDLADLNYDRLGLLPLSPQQFGRVDQITYPLTEEELLQLQGVEVRGTETAEVSP